MVLEHSHRGDTTGGWFVGSSSIFSFLDFLQDKDLLTRFVLLVVILPPLFWRPDSCIVVYCGATTPAVAYVALSRSRTLLDTDTPGRNLTCDSHYKDV